MGSLDNSAKASLFQQAPLLAPDGIFEVTKRYVADGSPTKINLGQGSYRDENGQPWILPSVRMAKLAIADANHEYLAVAGLKEFREEAEKLVFKGMKAYDEGRIASVQSLSGTGALLLAGLTLERANSGIKHMFITEPTWAPHNLIFASQGYTVHKLPYYDDKSRSFDFAAFMAVLKEAPPHSAVVLHACAHNPTGCDPSRAQWREIAAVVQEGNIFPLFDSAYLGFNTGSVAQDVWAIRYFVDELGLEAAVCMSFAKSMGLYSERVGLVAYVTASPETTRAVFSLLEKSQRATVSTPPAYGARIAHAVLGTPKIREQWDKDLITMSGRIADMRQKLYELLVELKTPGDWTHIVKATGMFAYTGINQEQVEHLEAAYHVYMATTGRISVAGLNDQNIEYFAKALDQTVRDIPYELPTK